MLALLAAGQSRRFGDRDKLSAMLGGKMLGLHAAQAAADSPFSQKLVIASPDPDCAAGWRDLGYRVVANPDAVRGQATSVRLAAAHAIEAGASALCVMLADMPFVTSGHLARLIESFEQAGETNSVASARSGQAMPPAIFPSGALDRFLELQGDAGARKLLADALLVEGDDQFLIDIDTPADLAEANRIFRPAT